MKIISQTQADPSDPSDKSDSTPSKPSLKGGLGGSEGLGGSLLQNHINQGGNVANVDFAVAVDVAHGIGIGAAAEDFVD